MAKLAVQTYPMPTQFDDGWAQVVDWAALKEAIRQQVVAFRNGLTEFRLASFGNLHQLDSYTVDLDAARRVLGDVIQAIRAISLEGREGVAALIETCEELVDDFDRVHSGKKGRLEARERYQYQE